MQRAGEKLRLYGRRKGGPQRIEAARAELFLARGMEDVRPAEEVLEAILAELDAEEAEWPTR